MTGDYSATMTYSPSQVTDWGRMQTARVQHIAMPHDDAAARASVQHARQNNLKVCVRGIGHSAGGQSFCDNGLMIDMRHMNRILDMNPETRVIRVQAGATWADLTRALEPHKLAITTKQEFDTFTIGGSVAANVHGKSIDYGPLIETIESFRLLTPNADVIHVSRTENSELFSLVIGGYGLFGVVLDVTFQLVVDRLVHKTEVVYMNLDPLVASYVARIRRDPRPPLCYGFLTPLCDVGYYMTYEYVADESRYAAHELKRDEPRPFFFNLFVLLQRLFQAVRNRSFALMWAASAKPEVTFRSRRLLLWDRAPRAFQDMLLQKYFVPVENFAEFARRVGKVFQVYGNDLPLITNHFRFVPGNSEALLSFSPRDSICMIPCYLARKDSPRWIAQLERATRELLNAALELGGRYYLTFDIIATPQQLRQAYPDWQQFVEQKRRHDPSGVFSSRFYEKYASQ